MAIERLLGEEVGAVAGKLHTGRSRNDQVATDIAMVVKAASHRAMRLCAAAMEGLLRSPRRTRTGRCPATPTCSAPSRSTSATTCSPTSGCSRATPAASPSPPIGQRDAARLRRPRRASTGRSTAAIVAAELGFAGITPNSLDGTSNRDFVIDYLSAAATCAMHLSRLGSELVIWSSTEFGFVELDEAFSSGSSIMPQKKNPDSAELLRAKSPRVAAAHQTLLGVMHALPLTYGKDMQEDKEPLWDAIETIESSLEVAAGILEDIAFDRERAGGGLRRRDAGRDRGRRPAGPPGRALPRRPRDRRRAGPRRDRRRRAALRSQPRADRGAAPSCSATSTTRCCSGAAGWSRSRSPAAPAPSALARPDRRSAEALTTLRDAAGLTRPVSLCPHPAKGTAGAAARLGADFFDRVVHAVARELIGCTPPLRRRRRHDRRDRGLRTRRPRQPLLRRPHRAHQGDVRPARPRLRLPLLRHPQPAQLRLRTRRRGSRRPDPRPRTDDGARTMRAPPPPRPAPTSTSATAPAS